MFIVGATNRPDQIDPALMRGGRLSRTIVLGLPDESARLAILRRYSERMPTVAVSLEEIARRTEGLSPADLKALCQEAALAAMGRGKAARVGLPTDLADVASATPEQVDGWLADLAALGCSRVRVG